MVYLIISILAFLQPFFKPIAIFYMLIITSVSQMIGSMTTHFNELRIQGRSDIRSERHSIGSLSMFLGFQRQNNDISKYLILQSFTTVIQIQIISMNLSIIELMCERPLQLRGFVFKSVVSMIKGSGCAGVIGLILIYMWFHLVGCELMYNTCTVSFYVSKKWIFQLLSKVQAVPFFIF